MKVRDVKNIVSSALMGLLVSTLFIAGSQLSSVEASGEPSEGNVAATASSDEVAAASGSNRFVVWTDNAPGNYDIFFRRSTDNGATWKAIVNLSNNPGASKVPLIAVSGSNVYVVWLQYSSDVTSQDVFFRKSTDNGATWGAKLKITQTAICGTYCTLGVPQIVASGSNIFVLFQNGDPGDIFLRRSIDSGVTWDPIVNLSSNPGHSTDPAMAVSGSSVYVVWTQGNTAKTSWDVFFRRSVDNGATWKSKVNFSNDPLGDSGDPAIAAYGSTVHVVWHGQGSDGRDYDPLYKRSTDKGVTWKSVQNLGTDWDSFDSQIAVSGSNVFVAFDDQGAVWLRRSTDSGATWKDAFYIGAGGSDYDIGYNWLVAGSNIYFVWTINPSAADVTVLFRGSTDGGATWGEVDDMGDVFTMRRSGVPQIAASGSTVFLVTASKVFNTGSDIFMARSTDNGGTWKQAVNLSKNAGVSETPQIAL